MRLTFAQLHAPSIVFTALGLWGFDCWSSPLMIAAVVTVGFAAGHLAIGAMALTLSLWHTYVTGKPRSAPRVSPLHPDLPLVADPSMEEELWFAFERAFLYRCWGVEALIRGVFEMFTKPPVIFPEDEELSEALVNSVAFQYMELSQRVGERKPPRCQYVQWGSMSSVSSVDANGATPRARARLASSDSFMSIGTHVQVSDDDSSENEQERTHFKPQRVVSTSSSDEEKQHADAEKPSTSPTTSAVRDRRNTDSPTHLRPATRPTRSATVSTMSRPTTMKSPRSRTAMVRKRSRAVLQARPSYSQMLGRSATAPRLKVDTRVPGSPQSRLQASVKKPDVIAPKRLDLPPVKGLRADEEVWTMDLSMFEDCKSYGGVYFKGVVARFASVPKKARAMRFLDITIVGNGTFYPPSTCTPTEDCTDGDPGSWKLAKTFLMQAVSYNALWVDHTATHLPMDAFIGTSMSVLPESHVVYQLIYPHTRHTLALEDSLFWASGSPVNHDETQMWKTWSHGRDEHLKKLVYGCKHHDFSRRIREIEEKDGLAGAKYLLLHHAAIHEFVKNVLDAAKVNPKTDIALLEWERQMADCVVGLPNIADTPNPRAALAQVLSTFIFEVSVRHSYDHQSLYHHIPIEWAPLRISVPPPVEGTVMPEEMLKPTDVVKHLDHLKHRIFADVFMQWSRNPLLDQSLGTVQYGFKSGDLQQHAAAFRQNLADINNRLSQSLGRWHLPLHIVAPSIQW